jgi:hypothetical protein
MGLRRPQPRPPRHANRLYLTAEGDSDRAEYAPAGPSPDPLERLARQLERSSAQVLAIDSGRPLETEADTRRHFSWFPSRRRDRAAAIDSDSNERTRAEAAHGELPFEAGEQFDASVARTYERVAERETERVLRQDREMGRGL